MMAGEQSKWQRRAVMAGGVLALAAWVKGAPYLASLGGSDLEFEPLPGLEPFRFLKNAGTVSQGLGGDIFVGVDAPVELSAEERRREALVRADPCTAFYGTEREGPLLIAVFTDFACPNCRLMEGRLDALAEASPGQFRVIYHQLPILTEGSAVASRAVLAAGRQGAYHEMHRRLLRTVVVTDLAYVNGLASDLGLDAERFRADIISLEIDQELQMSRTIARVFGFYGTPAFAVGRTVFLGAVPEAMLEALIAEEAQGACLPG